MSRLKSIIAAGALTGMVVITAVAFGVRDLSTLWANNNNRAIAADSNPAQPQVDLQTMLEREAEYRQKLEEANQTIQELQSQEQQRFSDDDDWYEEDEEHDEYEEHDDD